MSGENRSRVGGDGCFDFVRIDGEFAGQNIHINRLATLPEDTSCGGHVRKRRGDNFSFEIQGFDGQLQGDGAIADKKQVIQGEVFFELEFQLID
jgi:hypothetical protein